MPVTLVTTVGSSSANSYVDLAQAQAYIESHYVPASVVATWDSLTSDQKSAALIRAAQLLDRHVEWTGDVAGVGQALSWPRAFTYDRYGRAIDSLVIPAFLAEFQIETALWLVAQGGTVPEGTSSEFDSIKVGPIDIDFNTRGGGSKTTFLPESVIAALAPVGSYKATTRGGISYANVVRS